MCGRRSLALMIARLAFRCNYFLVFSVTIHLLCSSFPTAIAFTTKRSCRNRTVPRRNEGFCLHFHGKAANCYTSCVPKTMSVATQDQNVPTTQTNRCVDIGINLTHKALKSHWKEVVQRAIDEGVETILLTGTSVKTSRESLSLAKSWHEETSSKNLYCTVGVHPHDAKHFSSDENELQRGQSSTTVEQMREILMKDPFAIAVGECGLDYNRNFSSKEDQLRAFREQVRLACELKMPLFVHEREGHEDLVKVLDEAGPELPPVVVHCFTGTREEAMAYIDRGYWIGLTGFICKAERGKQVREFLPDIPLDRIMIETDAPFMGFKKGKKRHSEPAHVVDVARKLSEVMNIPFEQVCDTTTSNALKFFRIN